MTRPLQHHSDSTLREHFVHTEDRLIRLNSMAHDLANALEERQCRFIQVPGDDIKGMLSNIDYERIVQEATQEARDLLEEEMRQIEDEYEQRKMDIEDAADATGGIAA